MLKPFNPSFTFLLKVSIKWKLAVRHQWNFIEIKQLGTTFKIWALFISAASSLILPIHDDQLTICSVLLTILLMCISVSFFHAFAPDDLSAEGTPYPIYPVHLYSPFPKFISMVTYSLGLFLTSPQCGQSDHLPQFLKNLHYILCLNVFPRTCYPYLFRSLSLSLLIFSPAFLRYLWHTTLYKCNVYNMSWYMYTLKLLPQ